MHRHGFLVYFINTLIAIAIQSSYPEMLRTMRRRLHLQITRLTRGSLHLKVLRKVPQWTDENWATVPGEHGGYDEDGRCIDDIAFIGDHWENRQLSHSFWCWGYCSRLYSGNV
jgi:hypothetical protein